MVVVPRLRMWGLPLPPRLISTAAHGTSAPSIDNCRESVPTGTAAAPAFANAAAGADLAGRSRPTCAGDVIVTPFLDGPRPLRRVSRADVPNVYDFASAGTTGPATGQGEAA